jgi:hypothetical protein
MLLKSVIATPKSRYPFLLQNITKAKNRFTILDSCYSPLNDFVLQGVKTHRLIFTSSTEQNLCREANSCSASHIPGFLRNPVI